MRTFVIAFMALAAAHAVETKTWVQDTQDEFEKGNLKNISIRSDGRLRLAPVFRELLDASAPYLWALAEDSKGNVYAGGGGPGGTKVKLYQIDSAGKTRAVAEIDGLEIHAIGIDRRDRVYAATSPDGKIYRISAAGKPELFYDPHSKYTWAMAFNSKGELYVATGDLGEIHRVGADGKGSVFFKSDETHARSLAIDKQDNLIVGAEPGGLILRVSPAGEGFILHQAGKREVTAVAVAPDGTVYAAAVGTKSAPAPPSTAPAPVAPPPAAPPGVPGAMTPRPVATPPPTLIGGGPTITGGSEVWRIDREGFPRRIWNHSQDIVYAIGFDSQGRPLIGAGNKGSIYRLDSDVLSTLLVNAQPTQVTAFCQGRQGRMYVATGNVGKVYQLGPEPETQGTVESDVLDAQVFSNWGRLSWDGAAADGQISFQTRSGNLDRPQKNWSPWAPAKDRVASPPARFLQWKLTMSAAPGGKSPEINSVEVAWLPRNVAPVIERIEITPGNYRFPAPSLSLTPTQNLTLPPIGQKRRPSAPSTMSDSGSSSMQYAKGYIGARWLAADQNGDAMTYTVEIRGAGEKEWKLLKDKVKEKHLSWDASGFPDGEYVLRITASDSPSNPPANALTGQGESDPFIIDNTPPQITALAARRSGARVEVSWKAADERSVLEKAEYSMNGGDWLPVLPTTRLADSLQHDYQLSLDNAPSGEVTIAVRVTDAWDNQSAGKVVVR